MNRSCLLLGLSVLLAWPAVAETATLLPDHDATLYEDATGATANGSGQYIFTGITNRREIRRALLSFPLDSLPSGSVIDSVSLRLHMSKTASGSQTATLHRVLTAWNEGPSDASGSEGRGTTALAGDTTWLHTFHDTATWTNVGGDFVAAESAARLIGDEGFYTFGPSAELAADVQLWLDDPAANHGWILIGEELFFPAAKRFDSRENPDTSVRPVLTVEFTPPPTTVEVPALSSVGWGLLALLLAATALQRIRGSSQSR